MMKWMDALDERQRKQVEFSRLYADSYNHGASGHNDMTLIARLAELLDQLGEGKEVSKPDRADQPVGFGKYRLRTLRQLVAEDPEYLEWLGREAREPDVRDAVARLLDRPAPVGLPTPASEEPPLPDAPPVAAEDLPF